MRYYAKCNNVNNSKEIQLLDENDNLLFIIHKFIGPLKTTFEIYNANNERVYHVNFYPLKVKNRYLIKNRNDKVVVKISTGLHLLHHIEYQQKHFVCKSNLFRINYTLYDYDVVVGRLNVVKKDHLRYFEISIEDEEDVNKAIAMYVVAQAQRMWFLRK